jgi:predicted AAA+ superfamily ATPase
LFHKLELGGPFLQDNGLESLTRREFWSDLATHGRRLASARDRAFGWFSRLGGYPLAHERADIDWAFIADQLNENVIRRVIQHDLRVGARGRKRDANLLEEVFRLACRYVGQSPGLDTLAREVQRSLSANIGPRRIKAYLMFLHNTLLIRVIDPLELRLKRRKGNSKICLADHALRASWLQEMVPLDPALLEKQSHLSDLAGHIAESVAGVVLSTIHGLDIAHLPSRQDQPEVDFVLTVGDRRIPLEVKYRRRIQPMIDTEGVRTFLEKAVNNAPFAILATQTDDVVIDDPRIIAMPLSTLMLLR